MCQLTHWIWLGGDWSPKDYQWTVKCQAPLNGCLHWAIIILWYVILWQLDSTKGWSWSTWNSCQIIFNNDKFQPSLLPFQTMLNFIAYICQSWWNLFELHRISQWLFVSWCDLIPIVWSICGRKDFGILKNAPRVMALWAPTHIHTLAGLDTNCRNCILLVVGKSTDPVLFQAAGYLYWEIYISRSWDYTDFCLWVYGSWLGSVHKEMSTSGTASL